ncbi:MAG TPA: VWA domain-containing protein [Bacilli bacterium]|nr:VWA domain-containing protein [Bacilli bacterium]
MNLLSPWMLLFLLALPAIILLYLLKRTYEKQTVPSILLWQKLLREMEANRPWQKLRRNILLLLQLLAAALFAFSLARPTVPGSAPLAAHTIAVLDLSASMAAQTGETTRLERSKQELHDIIDSLSPQQRLTLIGMGGEARVLSAGNDPSQLDKVLDEVRQEYGGADYEGALSLAAALSAQDPAASVLLYSDGNWGLDPKLLPIFGSVTKLINGAVQAESNANETANVGIRHAAALAIGTTGSLVATVENYGEQPAAFDIQLFDAKGDLLAASSLNLPPHEQQAVTWEDLPLQDTYKVALTSQDALALDNEWIVLTEQSGSSNIWVATQGNLFLEKALALGGTASVERGTDPEAPPKDAALYVYDNYLPKEWPQGAVLLVNPPQGAGIVSTGDALEPGKLQVTAPDSPILQHVDLSKLHLQSVRDVQAVPWLQPLVKSGDTPILYAGEQEGHRIAVLAFDLHRSDLPLLPAFPLLIQHLKEDLLPAADSSLGETEVGGRVALLSPIRETGWQVTDPSGAKRDVEPEMVEHGFTPTEPGLYRFQDEAGEQQMLLAVHTPPAESTVAPSQVSLPTTGGGEDDPSAGGKAHTALAEQGHREIWRYVAMLILLLTFVEWGVYKRGY